MFDPVDGPSNIDVNMSVGTIFSILGSASPGADARVEDFLQPGAQQVCAGFALYGPSTMLVLTTGEGVDGFTLDRDIGAFVLTHPQIRIPEQASEFAVNASNERFWQPPVKRYVAECLVGRNGPRGKDFNMRWVASLVAEAFRILTRGGVFLYPADSKDPGRDGRLRLMYEGNPIAFIIEQAGGAASTGRERVMDIVPSGLHQRVPLIFGSRDEEERIAEYHRDLNKPSHEGFSLFNTRSLFRDRRSRGAIMSVKHPVVAITGSSGAGTTSVTKTLQQIFRREKITPALVEGDSFHRFGRAEMAKAMADAATAGNHHFCHFGPEANLFEELGTLFRGYGETGTGKIRKYLHDEGEAAPYGLEPGGFTDWEEIPPETDMLFYEGLHGAVVTESVNVAQHADLIVGVVPIINLEWIQKLHRDQTMLGYSSEAVVDTVLRRMPDYVDYICPQFSRTHVNFQRVPTVDTPNPFIARFIPTADESFLVIRFADSKGIDFSYLLAMLHDSFMSRPNIIVVPGGKMELAMQLIFTPMIMRLMEQRQRA